MPAIGGMPEIAGMPEIGGMPAIAKSAKSEHPQSGDPKSVTRNRVARNR
jgi:hypothetical protein